MRVLVFLFLVGLSVCLTPVNVHADQNEPATKTEKINAAKKAFVDGSAAYKNGDFITALAGFTSAYKLTGSADLLYNIATVNDRMRRDEEALRAYLGYIEARPASPDREHVEGRIKVLRASMRAREQAEREAATAAERKALDAAAAAEERIKAERPLTHYVGPGPGPWVMIGVSSAALAAGAVVFGLGQRDKNKVEGAGEGVSFSEVQSEYDRAPRRVKIGLGMMGVGVAGALGGLIWQLTGGHDEKMPEVSVGPGTVSVRGTF